MSQKENLQSFLRLSAIINSKPGETPEETRARVDRYWEKSTRKAEVEQILAEYALDGMPIPGDVTNKEIKSAFMRFKNNTITRLNWRGYVSHGISYTQSARQKVLEIAASGKPLVRDANELSRSAVMRNILDWANSEKRVKPF